LGGKPHDDYKFFIVEKYKITASRQLGLGNHVIRCEFKYGGGVGKGGVVTLFVDGKIGTTGSIENRSRPVLSGRDLRSRA
jgi:hypothetical protein